MQMSENTQEKLTMKQWLPLIGMSFAAFLFNTSEFMPVGLLSTIAEDFAMTEAEIGRIVSIYAWMVMVLSMPLMVMASKYSMRTLILGTIGIFIVSNGLASIAADFWSLLGARLVLTTGHAIYWSIATPAAVRLVAPKFKAVAMSMLVAGSSLATILGLPIGRVIGLQLGWRMSFFSLAAVAACIIVYMFFFFPKMEKTEPFSFKQLPELFKNKVLLGLYGITILIPTAQYASYSYIEPFMKYVVQMSANTVTMALVIIGCAGFVGSIMYTKLYDRYSNYFLPVSLMGMTLVLLSLHIASYNEFVFVGVLIVWGIIMIFFGMSSQAVLLQVTSISTAPVAMSIYSGIFNFGIGSGTWVGGFICDHINIAYIGYGAGIFAVLGTLGSLLVVKELKRGNY